MIRKMRYLCSFLAVACLLAAIWSLAQGYTLLLDGFFLVSACVLAAIVFWLKAKDPLPTDIGSPENKSRILFGYRRKA